MPYEWNKRLVLIRGLPGSGKSTLASVIFRNQLFDARSAVDYLVEADDYRMVGGEYVYDPAQDALAHAWCLSETFRRLQSQDVVIVANVFSRREHLFPYLEAARRLQVRVQLLETSTDWAQDAEKLTDMNVHDVPIESIERMKESLEEISQREIEILVGHPWE